MVKANALHSAVTTFDGTLGGGGHLDLLVSKEEAVMHSDILLKWPDGASQRPASSPSNGGQI